MVIAPLVDMEHAATERDLQDQNFRKLVEVYRAEFRSGVMCDKAYRKARESARQWEDIADMRAAALDECEGKRRALKVWAGIGKGVVISVGVVVLAVGVDQYLSAR